MCRAASAALRNVCEPATARGKFVQQGCRNKPSIAVRQLPRRGFCSVIKRRRNVHAEEDDLHARMAVAVSQWWTVAERALPRLNFGSIQEDTAMLHYALVFLVIAIIAAVLGFGGIAGAAAGIAKILFVIFLIFAIIAFFRRAR